MAYLDQLQLPNNSVYNLSVPFIVGTGTTAGTWAGTLDGLTAYYDGLLILYKPPVAGASTTTLNINSLGAKTVYMNNTTKLTTHFPANQPILLVYSASTNSGCWVALDCYDSGNTNTQVRVYRQTTGYNADYPILVSRTTTIGTAGTDGSYTGVYGVVHDTTQQPTVNPSTGEVKALKFTGSFTGDVSGNAATATKATQDSNGNTISSTYLKLSGGTMTGVIISSYKCGTWLSSLNSSAITLTDTAGSFGGWICGPTKDGRIAISSYQNSDNKLHFGYGERGRTDNSYAQTMTWDGPTNTLSATKFIGALQGNADTASDATKLNGYASDTSATNNTIARRTANGYLFATYLNQSSGAETPTSSSYWMYCNSDGYLRKSSLTNLKSQIGISNYLPLSGGTLTGRLTTQKPINQIITGSGTAQQDKGSGVSPRYFPVKWTFNTGMTATDGDIFTIKIPIAGHDWGVFVSVDNGTNYYPVGLLGTGRLTTHYPVNTYLTLIFEANGQVNDVIPVAGGDGRTNVTGGAWRVINYYDSNSNDTGYYLRRIYPNLKVGANKIFPYTLIMQNADGRWESIVTSSSTGTSKARNSHGFRLGQVLLMYANATYNENATVGTYNIWTMHSGLIDHRYSFNTANNSTNGTTGYQPVYIVGALGNDGLFYLDAKWWTQTLPSTADGKLYIYIGDAYDYYRMTFVDTQKIYRYVNGMIREYTQDAGTVNGLTVEKAVPSNAVFTDHYAWNDITGKPSEFAPSSGSNYYVKSNRSSSQSTATKGEWVSMCNSTQTGSPTLPTAGKWWHVLSLDCWGSAPNNWTSQLAIATTDGNGVWWRRNDSSNTSIDSSTWHRLADGDANGNATNANKVNNLTVQTAVPANALFTDTNYYHTTGSWSGLTYTATANGGAGALAFTIPTGTSATTAAVGNHAHGTLNNDFTIVVANTTEDSGWSMINSTYNGFLLKSIRYQASSPAWGVGNFGSGICFGGSDTKGILSVSYNTPNIKIAGGNGTKPVWWIGLSGTSGTTYNLANMITTSNIGSQSVNYATSAGSATKATISNTNPTSSTTYFIPFVASSGDQGLNANNGLKYYCLQGTTSAAGWGELVLGNSTSTGTAGNKSGWIKLFSEKSGQAELTYTAAATANTVHYLPAVGGTLLNTGNYMNYIIPGTNNVTVNSYAATGSEHTIISNVTTTNGYGIIISRDMSRMIIFKCYGGTLTQQNNSDTLVLSKNSNNSLTLKNSQGQAAFGLIITT